MSTAPPEPVTGRIAAGLVVGDLEQPTAFTFDHDGRIWIAEKASARISIFDPASRVRSTFFVVDRVVSDVEQGLVGIALDPAFPQKPFVYVFATRQVAGSLMDQVIRITSVDDRGRDPEVVLSSAASALHQHSGGRLLFGPDGLLYLALGDALQADLAQDPASLRGKILRIDTSGETRPEVFASGLRNSFGIAFDPVSGVLWETENGPECNDELNVVPEGANLGWGPSATCDSGAAPRNTNADGSNVVMPQRYYDTTIAPTGVAFCMECHLGTSREGTLFFGSYNDGSITEATVSKDRMQVIETRVVLQPAVLVLSMERGPDGSLYYSTYLGIFRLELLASQDA